MEGSLDGLPTKDEMAQYLQRYVKHFDIPVYQMKVEKLKKNQDGSFQMLTNKGLMKAEKKVIVATGAFQKPYLPIEAVTKKSQPFHIHSSAYRSPEQVQGNDVLIAGGGNSGAQIAAKEKNVTMAVSHPFKFLPLRFLGKSIFSWLERMGLLYAGIDTLRGKWFQKQSDPIFGHALKPLFQNKQIK